MDKIRTLFERDGKGRVTTVPVVDVAGAIATEKLDGSNVRLTVRNHTLVRLEKRRNPDKAQKAAGIITPWYVDASETAPADRYLWEAARNTNLSNVDDGEWSGEALGPKIQGNPLWLEVHTVALFSVPAVRAALTFAEQPPVSFEDLPGWMARQTSHLNPAAGIEGIVWWLGEEPVGKIKRRDFVGKEAASA